MTQAIVCGAGAAGLASAACLNEAGLDTLVLERGDSVGASWRDRYGALRLNTLGTLSSLPGVKARPRRYGGAYPSRNDWVRYLEDYAEHHGIEPRFGVAVTRVDREDGGWRVETSDGSLEAPVAVVAVGPDREPHIPRWPGSEDYPGELSHAADYRDPEPYRGKDLLIVGAGNTGSEIAAFLASGGAQQVRVSCRTPPNIFPRKWLGLHMNYSALGLDLLPMRMADAMGRMTQRMIYGDLAPYGLPFPPDGVRTTVEQRLVAPAIDAGFVEAVKDGRIEIVPTIERFEGPEVVLTDGARLQPDAVICATGYERALEPLVGHLGVLEANGLPRAAGRELPDAPGLYFVGYTVKVSGMLRQHKFDARRVAKAARRRVRSAGSSGRRRLQAA